MPPFNTRILGAHMHFVQIGTSTQNRDHYLLQSEDDTFDANDSVYLVRDRNGELQRSLLSSSEQSQFFRSYFQFERAQLEGLPFRSLLPILLFRHSINQSNPLEARDHLINVTDSLITYLQYSRNTQHINLFRGLIHQLVRLNELKPNPYPVR